MFLDPPIRGILFDILFLLYFFVFQFLSHVDSLNPHLTTFSGLDSEQMNLVYFLEDLPVTFDYS